MESRTTLDRVRAMFNKDAEQNYEPLGDASTIEEDVHRPVLFMPDHRESQDSDTEQDKKDDGEPFSWFEYSIFLLLGIAMLWAW
jgi:solute carrier family 29 (equilibrative nucleoside transporter), member 1/2/3